MIRLLDTNTCIYFLNKASDRIIDQFKKFSPADVRLSSITVAELFYGAEKSKAKKNNWAVVEKFVSTFEVVAFDRDCCREYARVRALLERSGSPIGPMDLLIAAISLANDFILVTNNTKEFSRVKTLKLENWL
jgi:tRNA(fMet)-specific endonuclease VapC